MVRLNWLSNAVMTGCTSMMAAVLRPLGRAGRKVLRLVEPDALTTRGVSL